MKRLLALVALAACHRAPAWDHGSAPRRLFTIAPAHDEKRAVDGTVTLKFARTLTATVAADETIHVAPDGVVETYKLTNVDGTPEVKMLASQLIGATLTLTVDKTGRVTNVAASAEGAIGAQLTARLAALRDDLAGATPHFPPEPIGVGARWAISSAKVKATAELTGAHELTIDGTSAALHLHAVETLDDDNLWTATTIHAGGTTSQQHPIDLDATFTSVAAP